MDKKLKYTIDKMNELGSKRFPFLFIFDYEMKVPVVLDLHDINKSDIQFCIQANGIAESSHKRLNGNLNMEVNPVSKDIYEEAFYKVMENINFGNSYLLNLTFPSQINLTHKLKDIYEYSRAKYKLLYKNKFVVFSPETFVKIKDNSIFSYPMKGTIDASIPGARIKLENDEKEIREHYTIVDLIRNDLSRVAKKVKVTNFRYFEKIKSNKGELYQTSSEIEGQLPSDWNDHIGDIFLKILPAGSISGAPKKKTMEVIRSAEQQDRGYYTGVFGYFDGNTIDSSVMIRFIENRKDQLYFRSGGGITSKSDLDSEYNELIQKIYVPID